MAIGRPIELTPNITSKNISIAATEGQTEFTVTGGYRINEIGVYRNGVRLVDGRDFSATDGQTVTFISDTVIADDIVEFSILDSFDIAGTIVSAASTQTLNGNLHVTGSLFAGVFNPTNLVSTAATINSTFHVGSALTANAAGDVESIGIITAATFKGDGSGLTGIGETLNVRTNTITVSGVSTFTGVSNFSAAINADATTDSTSTSTGALIVDGGVGIAKNVYIGAGLSVAGTLTYEDVTNVDSVGMVTAKSGVNVSGGELNVGLGFSVGNVGVVTAQNVTISAGTIDLKNSGSVSNIKFYCESSNAHYTALQSAAHSAYGGNVTLTLPTTTDTLVARTTTDTLTNKTLTSPTLTTPVFSGQATGELKVGSGITMAATSGVATFADGSTTTNGLHFGSAGDLKIYHDGTNSQIRNGTGSLLAMSDTFDLRSSSSNENMIKGVLNGAVELYYNGGKTLETTANGVTIYDDGKDDEGRLIVQGGEGNAASLYLYADDGDDNADKWRVYSTASGTFGIESYSTGSWVSGLSITDTGVGIGTSPTRELTLYSPDSGSTYINLTNATTGTTTSDGFGIGLSGSEEAKIWNYENTNMIFGTNATERFRVTADGPHLLLGGTSDVNEITESSSNAGIVIGNTSDYGNAGIAIVTTNTGTGRIYFGDGVTNSADRGRGSINYYHNGDYMMIAAAGSERFRLHEGGTVTTGIGTFSNGLDTVGMLRESFNTTAGKLSDNTNIDLAQGMVHYFTTQETTTSTPNIRFSSSYSLNNMMNDGDAITVTIITTAAAGGYSAQLTIDGSAVTEQWVGGAAPSAGGSDGYDILTYNILKTSNATFFVIGNLVNAT